MVLRGPGCPGALRAMPSAHRALPGFACLAFLIPHLAEPTACPLAAFSAHPI